MYGKNPRKKGKIHEKCDSYLCTYDLYSPVHNAFDAGSIHNEGKW